VAAEAGSVNGESVLTVDEQASAATRFTDELVRAFGLSATIRADVVDDDIELRIDGSGLGVLVGPKGATLHALEELVRAVVHHAAGGQSARLHVDVAGYRERRREALAAFAEQVAAEVRESGAERALEPMSPPDRKVVHDTVATLDGVATASVGEEPRRRVVIKPA
jgi:spoIIIJ-associated protein